MMKEEEEEEEEQIFNHNAESGDDGADS